MLSFLKKTGTFGNFSLVAVPVYLHSIPFRHIPSLSFQLLDIPQSSQPCIGACPVLGRSTTSLLGSRQSSLMDRPSLATIPSTNFSLPTNPLSPSILSTQPAPAAAPANGQSENFAAKKEASIPSTGSWQDGQARTVEESRGKEYLNTTSSQWVAQVSLKTNLSESNHLNT